VRRKLRNGKTRERTVQNLVSADVNVAGRIPDVGGDRPAMGVLIRKATNNVCLCIMVDLPRGQPWPTSDGGDHCVLLINLLYIQPNPAVAIRENPSGSLVFTFPFILNRAGHRLPRARAALLARSARLVSTGVRFCCMMELLGSFLYKVLLYSFATKPRAGWTRQRSAGRQPTPAM
jgi:hypothetical protein